MDGTHLRFTLREPAAFFPSTLVRPVARPMPFWAIAAHPSDWTEPAHIVTNGAYRLTAWTHGISMTLEKNPGYYDAANVQIGQVSFAMVDDTTAWAMYQARQLDSVVVPPSEWNAARSDPVLAPQLHVATRLGTYYYGFNTAKAPFNIPLVRKAFVGAVNRQGVIDLVAGMGDAGRYATVPGLPLALTFTAPGVWGHLDESAEGVGIPYDPVQARLWLAAAGYPDGQGLPPITLVYDPHPAHQAIAGYIQQNWTEKGLMILTVAKVVAIMTLTDARSLCPVVQPLQSRSDGIGYSRGGGFAMKRAWPVCGFLLLLAAVACGAPGRKTPTAGSPTPTGTPTPGATLPAALPTATATPLGAGVVPTPSPIPATKVPLCARYELQIELQVSTSFEDFWSQIDGKGHVPLTADLSPDPPRLTGSGEVPVSGKGMAGECPVVYSGAFVYTISGEILTDESGNPVLHLVGQVEGQVFGSSPCGGGGGGMPVPERMEITFPYQDRATESYTFSAPGATGRSTWTLDILCEP